MVTKKTRLLSAIAAVLMLVSMFAGFVIPASAEETTGLPSITGYHDGTETNVAGSYTVSTVKELELLSLYKTTLTGTIYITGDIDVSDWTADTYSDIAGDVNNMAGLKASLDGYPNGDRGTIRGLAVVSTNGGWLGNHATGKTIKNLNFIDCHVTGIGNSGALLNGNAGKTVEYANLSFYGCTATKGTGANGLGLVTCKLGAANTKFTNIDIVNCKLIDGTNYTAGPVNYGFLIGCAAKIGLKIENIRLINNTIEGTETNAAILDSSHGALIGELSYGGTINNVFVSGTNFNYGKMYSSGNLKTTGSLIGALCGYAYNSSTKVYTDYNTALTLNNVIMVNTTVAAGVSTAFTNLVGGVNIDVDKGYLTELTASNIVTDRSTLNTGNVTNVTTGENLVYGYDDEDPREAAWILNQAAGNDKWTLESGTPAISADGTDRVVKVTVAFDNDAFDPQVIYANANSTIDVTHEKASETAVYALEETELGTLDGTTLTLNADALNDEDLAFNITVTDTTINTEDLEALIAAMRTNGVSNYVKDETTLLTEDVLAGIEAKIGTYADQDEVTLDYNELDSYKLTTISTADVEAVTEIQTELAKLEGLTHYFDNQSTVDAFIARVDAALAAAEAADDGLEINAANTELAEVQEDYDARQWTGQVPYKYYAAFEAHNIKTWAISDETDWRTAVGRSDHTFDGETLTLTADIDMTADGDNTAVAPLCWGSQKFRGTLDGGEDRHVFKNLLIDQEVTSAQYVGLVSRLYGTIQNLGIESGEVKISAASARSGIGAFAGRVEATGKLLRSWAGATVSLSGVAEGTADGADFYIGGLVGVGTDDSTIDGCYFIGSVDAGENNHTSGLNDWARYTGRVYNSFDFSTLDSGAEGRVEGAIRIGQSAGDVNNYKNTFAIGRNVIWYSSALKATSSYLPAYFISEFNATNGNLLESEYSSGELAWKLNENKYDAGNGYTYYTVENEKTVIGDETNYTCRIAVVDGDTTMYVYGNVGDTITIEGTTYTFGTNETANVEGVVAHDCAQEYEIISDNYFSTWNGDELESISLGQAHVAYCAHTATVGDYTAYCAAQDAAVACDYEEEITTEAGCETEGLKTFTCACGDSYTETIAAGHKEVDVEAQAPTCTEDGTTAGVKCSVCGEIISGIEVDPATGHTEVDVEAQAPTCTEDGTTAGVKCSVCGETISGIEVDPATGHSYEETITVAPTCTATGVKTYTCACEDTYTETIDALGHEMTVEVSGKVDATCGKDGKEAVIGCSRCDYTEGGAVISATGDHSYDDGVITTEPTVDAVGVKTYTCGVCGGTKTEDVAPLTAVAQIGEQGYATLQEAADIGGEITLLKDLVLDARVVFAKDATLNLGVYKIESNEIAIQVIEGATLTIEGEGGIYGGIDKDGNGQTIWAKGGHVVINGGTYKSDIDQTAIAKGDPHSNDTIYTSAEGTVKIYGGTFIAVDNVWLLNCNNSNEGTIEVYGGTFVGFNPEKENGIDWTEVNFLADGYHSIGVEGTYTVSAHVEEIIPAVDATCTETGLTEGEKCSVCGEILKAQEETAALGHTEGEVVVEKEVAADCTNTGSYDNVVYCAVCKAEVSRETVTVDALGHAEEIIPAVGATCTKTGLTEGEKCSVCGDILVAQEETAALGHKKAIDQNNKIICGVCGDALETEAGIIYVNGAGYLVDENGDLVDGVFAEWGNYGELFIKEGQPSGTGVFEWKEHGYVYITSKHKLAGEGAPTLFYLNDLAEEEKANLGIAGDKFYGYYLVEDGKLVDKTFANWNETFTDLYIVNGQPSGAGVFDIEGYGLVYVTAGHKIAGKGEAPALHHLGNLSDEDKDKLGITRNDYANYYLFKDGKIFSNDFADWNETYTNLFIVNGQPSGAGVFEWVDHGKVYITAGHKLAGADAPVMYYLTNAQEEEMFEGKEYTDKYYNYYMIQGGKILAEGVADWGTLPYKDRYIVNGQPANGTCTISAEVAEILGVDEGTYTFSGGKIK